MFVPEAWAWNVLFCSTDIIPWYDFSLLLCFHFGIFFCEKLCPSSSSRPSTYAYLFWSCGLFSHYSLFLDAKARNREVLHQVILLIRILALDVGWIAHRWSFVSLTGKWGLPAIISGFHLLFFMLSMNVRQNLGHTFLFIKKLDQVFEISFGCASCYLNLLWSLSNVSCVYRRLSTSFWAGSICVLVLDVGWIAHRWPFVFSVTKQEMRSSCHHKWLSFILSNVEQ